MRVIYTQANYKYSLSKGYMLHVILELIIQTSFELGALPGMNGFDNMVQNICFDTNH